MPEVKSMQVLPDQDHRDRFEIVALHSEIVCPYVNNYGTAEQKAEWLPQLVAGTAISAIAMTEPGAGSDLQGMRTTAVADGDDGLSIAQYALPTSMEDHGDLFGNDQINKSKSIEEDPSLKRETVEETLRKAEDALQAIRDEEVESDVHLASVESETARTERIVKEPPMVFQEDPGQRRGTVVMGGSNRSGSVYVPPEDDGEAWEDASTPAKPDDGSQVEGTLPDLSTKGDAELSAIEKELMEGAL